MELKRDSFVFYRSFFEAIKGLPKEDQCLMFGAIADYSLDQIEPNLTGINKVVWTLIKPQLDANTKRFINGEKGGKHGRKGGRPKKTKPETKEENPIGVINENPKETPNVNVNVNLNDNLNVNEKDINICVPVKPKPKSINNEKIDFDELLKFFNDTFKKRSPFINQKLKTKYNSLMAQGYTKKQIGEAMLNASKDQYHIETLYKYCTLEFFTRADKIDKFSTLSEIKPKKELPANVGGGSMLKAL